MGRYSISTASVSVTIAGSVTLGLKYTRYTVAGDPGSRKLRFPAETFSEVQSQGEWRMTVGTGTSTSPTVIPTT